uniref:Putative secreted protein n=1 Tax=Ixodes ricinus TaxID=34613 RepID=A0A6B0UA84_IXORI
MKIFLLCLIRRSCHSSPGVIAQLLETFNRTLCRITVKLISVFSGIHLPSISSHFHSQSCTGIVSLTILPHFLSLLHFELHTTLEFLSAP